MAQDLYSSGRWTRDETLYQINAAMSTQPQEVDSQASSSEATEYDDDAYLPPYDQDYQPEDYGEAQNFYDQRDGYNQSGGEWAINSTRQAFDRYDSMRYQPEGDSTYQPSPWQYDCIDHSQQQMSSLYVENATDPDWYAYYPQEHYSNDSRGSAYQDDGRVIFQNDGSAQIWPDPPGRNCDQPDYAEDSCIQYSASLQEYPDGYGNMLLGCPYCTQESDMATVHRR